MKQITITLCILLIMTATMLYYRHDAIKNQKQTEIYKQNNEVLQNKLRSIYNEKLQLEQQNTVLEKASSKDKTIFDWNADISNSYVIRSLRQNTVRLSGTPKRTD